MNFNGSLLFREHKIWVAPYVIQSMIDPPLYLCWLAQQLASEMFKAVIVVVYESKIKDLGTIWFISTNSINTIHILCMHSLLFRIKVKGKGFLNEND